MNSPIRGNAHPSDSTIQARPFDQCTGLYCISTPTNPRYLYPLVIESLTAIYIARQKIDCHYDADSASLFFDNQTIENKKRSGLFKFSDAPDGKRIFTGYITIANPSSRDDVTGVQILKTQVWATPATSQSLQGSGLEHTWVTMRDASCWRSGGGGPTYYCSPDKWVKVGNTPVYFPPEGRLLNSTSAGDPNKANCVGGEESKFLGALDWFAGIVYGLNGVCHQMANRLLLAADKLTVSGAQGYTLSCIQFGRYGTIGSIEFVLSYFGWAALPAVIPALAAFLAGAQVEFGVRCGKCEVPYPGPVLLNQNTDDVLQEMRRMSVDELHSFWLDLYECHLADLKDLFKEKVGERINNVTLGALIALYREMLSPSRVVIEHLHSMIQPPLDLQQFEQIHLDTHHWLAFAHQFNERVNAQQRRVATLLSRDDYMALFDAAPEQELVLIDPQIMAK
ncbi:MAG: hypothetical protein HY836_17020 [Aquabacterium sp.]|uniref:hypothetical protein n=1 Tax=Aquabacterium sp. TaxID=1872578 RepID=UPI0025BD2657|nr:hypothetical protein [Aquabacterium sp.]MBI5927296.1 hypothetical protein [Aquabacterium sp.]